LCIAAILALGVFSDYKEFIYFQFWWNRNLKQVCTSKHLLIKMRLHMWPL
jgi:hypothetical protein